MDSLFNRLLLLGAATAVALHFPELIAWHRIRRANAAGTDPHPRVILALLRRLLRVVFLFYVVLLAYTLYHPVPSRFLVYPLPLLHLVAMIIGERDLPSELPGRRPIDALVRFLMVAGVLEIGLLTVIALQMHGVIPA